MSQQDHSFIERVNNALNQPQQNNSLLQQANDLQNIADDIIAAMPLYAAIERLKLELLKDKEPGSYYYTWQSNIAMAFYDAYRSKFSHENIEMHKIHKLANDAAINFLEILCSQTIIDSKKP